MLLPRTLTRNSAETGMYRERNMATFFVKNSTDSFTNMDPMHFWNNSADVYFMARLSP